MIRFKITSCWHVFRVLAKFKDITVRFALIIILLIFVHLTNSLLEVFQIKSGMTIFNISSKHNSSYYHERLFCKIYAIECFDYVSNISEFQMYMRSIAADKIPHFV